jgi:hypothetical protein
MTPSHLAGLTDRARDVLGGASWFAPRSQLMADCARLGARATFAYAQVYQAVPEQDVTIHLDTKVVVQRPREMDTRPITEALDGLAGALVARDELAIKGLSELPDKAFTGTRGVSLDKYQYLMKRAFSTVLTDPTACRLAIETGREAWRERKIAHRLAAEIDGHVFTVLETLVDANTAAFDDAVHAALVAHMKFWKRGIEYRGSRGWVALKILALVCVGHDRGISTEVESPYLPRPLITRDLDPGLGLAS